MHTYPYSSKLPIAIDGKYPMVEFTSDEDVWDAIDKVIEETRNSNEEGYDFDIASSVSSQVGFFACRNVFYDPNCQRDIMKYIYCKEQGVSAYPGFFGEQPKRWVDKFFLIKSALSKLEQREMKKAQRKQESNG